MLENDYGRNNLMMNGPADWRCHYKKSDRDAILGDIGARRIIETPTLTDWPGYQVWRPAFAAAMDTRLHTAEWLDTRLLAGDAQFWRSETAAAVTEVRTYPTGAYEVHGLVAAGNVNAVRDHIVPKVEAWGRAIGAIGIVIESRPGWARALRDVGFEPHQQAVRKMF